jgi:pimeloyl-ACP methyl ester carboxylesterase
MSLAERTASARSSGCEIQYRELNPGLSSGEPVVMLHGASGIRNDQRVFEAIAERHRLLIPSMPGLDSSTPGTAVLDFLGVLAALT